MIWDTLYIKSMNIEKLIDRGKFADEYSLNYVLLKKTWELTSYSFSDQFGSACRPYGTFHQPVNNYKPL